MAGNKFIAKGPAGLGPLWRVVLVSAPAKGLKQVKKPGNKASRNPPQRRRARARNGVAPYSPARFLGYRRDARSAGNGATTRRIRLRMLQAGPASGWKPAARRAGQRRRSWLCAKHDSRPDAQEKRSSRQEKRREEKHIR